MATRDISDVIAQGGTLLFLLIAGHFLGDFGLQSDTMAREKSRHSTTPLQRSVPWYWWLSAHTLIHGGIVTLLTGSGLLGMIEVGIHAIADWLKCENRTTLLQDQILHLLTKLGFWLWLLQTM
nr:DUF3307 domain-containing protein [Synechococcus elongatus PCC 11802]